MSDAAVAYVLGSGSISNVEAAKTWNSAGLYSLVQSFDSQRSGIDVGATSAYTLQSARLHPPIYSHGQPVAIAHGIVVASTRYHRSNCLRIGLRIGNDGFYCRVHSCICRLCGRA
ncbi:hypothetical protein BCV69DRAFT_111051 [Microstroma glucosiphilum]|uniref:Uncharacterized protein n=1 Tax=Pseudomicrostroma glucosiphilum TaxID=1684307 RepID=A0A316UDD5_9BASI|nr:hypothetical protein BCV69DRAFT_111051 [Pseudomicrostroma glucosiphilum]PWN23172.1 hypothetical protein BCV69DRAFT_111051 [Pseudomicrostroma glucosiphilum]